MPRDISSSSSSSSEDEDSGPEPQPQPTPAPEPHSGSTPSRAKFQCPADFVSFSYKPCSSSLKSSSDSELWLIKAPASFDPQSLSGLELPLCGLQTLRVPSEEGASEELTYSVLGSSRRRPELRLLTSPDSRASLASPFSGLISICQNHDETNGDRVLHAVPALPPPSLPPGLKARFRPTAAPLTRLETGKRRKKRIKTEPEEPCVRSQLDRTVDRTFDQTVDCVKTEVKEEAPETYETHKRKKKKKKKNRSDD